MDLDEGVEWKMSRVQARWQPGRTGTKPAVCTQRRATGEPVHGTAEKVISDPHEEELPPGEPELVPGDRIGNQ